LHLKNWVKVAQSEPTATSTPPPQREELGQSESTATGSTVMDGWIDVWMLCSRGTRFSVVA